jgi:hypothetical protein
MVVVVLASLAQKECHINDRHQPLGSRQTKLSAAYVAKAGEKYRQQRRRRSALPEQPAKHFSLSIAAPEAVLPNGDK